MKKEKQEKGLRVRRSNPFKLKDKPGRNFIPIHIIKNFGFIPEAIIIEKVFGQHDTIIVSAVLTEEEIKKEDERLEKLDKEKKVKTE